MKANGVKTGDLAAMKFGALLVALLAFVPVGAGAQAARGPSPQNMNALLEIRPLPQADGGPVAGRVRVELVVDPSGRITGCLADLSSGNANLDRHACEEVSKKLKMRPATDAAGNPVEGRFRTTIAFAGDR